MLELWRLIEKHTGGKIITKYGRYGYWIEIEKYKTDTYYNPNEYEITVGWNTMTYKEKTLYQFYQKEFCDENINTVLQKVAKELKCV